MVKDILKTLSKDLRLTERELDYLTNYKNILDVDLELKGKKIKAYRVQHNNDLGPFKGGIRFHPTVNLDEVKKLSFFMSIKTALVGLPLGGGKGGVVFDPRQHSKQEIEEVSREFVRKTFDFIGPDKDVPAPDVYTNPQIMSYMVDEYEKLSGKEGKASFTGKPLILGGSLGRDTATAKGGFFVLKEALKRKNVSNPTIAIQGFGNAGMHFAKFCQEEGYSVVGVSDSGGAVKGDLDVIKLIEHKKEKGSVKGFSEDISQQELLELDVDVLVLAALEDAIDDDNAGKVNAKIILELANGPIKSSAQSKVKSFVLPDILANSGGVIVSHFEYVQNKQSYYWKKEEVEEKLEEQIMNAFDNVYGNDMRKKCYEFAIKRILEAAKARGRL